MIFPHSLPLVGVNPVGLKFPPLPPMLHNEGALHLSLCVDEGHYEHVLQFNESGTVFYEEDSLCSP